jgi:NADPH-dependent 2,4-dienoyl-CoA reductase/sulfur reductase-like enzyme
MLINFTKSFDELGLDGLGRRHQLVGAIPGHEALWRGRKVPVDAAPTGKRVLMVGAGPSGLSAAYHLTRLVLAGRGRAAT